MSSNLSFISIVLYNYILLFTVVYRQNGRLRMSTGSNLIVTFLASSISTGFPLGLMMEVPCMIPSEKWVGPHPVYTAPYDVDW
jgi:hypothetical protein